jgi:hypothetical protein
MIYYTLKDLDEQLTHAIKDYLQTSVQQVATTIQSAWPPQIAALLMHFLMRQQCGDCDQLYQFSSVRRPDQDAPIIRLACQCALRPEPQD